MADILRRLNENLQCSICMEQYKDPRLLSCIHSFCLKCIGDHVGNSSKIRCPLCNEESEKPASGIEGLKSNFFIKGLIDDVVSAKAIAKEEVIAGMERKLCGCCDSENIAISNCNECECNLCSECDEQHKKLKIFRKHNVYAFPNLDDSGTEGGDNKTNKVIHEIKWKINGSIKSLMSRISYLRGKIQDVETKRDSTLSSLNESQQAFLKQINVYVDALASQIKENATERLGDLPDELRTCTKQVATYQTLKKQQEMLNELDIDGKDKFCQDLGDQLEQFQLQNPVQSFEGGREDLEITELVKGGAKNEKMITSCLMKWVGFLTPIKQRQARRVKIIHQDMSNEMKDYAIECAHDALDRYGKYPRSVNMLSNICDKITESFEIRYNDNKWSCIAAPIGCLGYVIQRIKMLEFNVDFIALYLYEVRQ